MRTGDKARVTRGNYVDREVTVGKKHPDFKDFWWCAITIQKHDKRTGKTRDTEAATEVLLNEGQLEVIKQK